MIRLDRANPRGVREHRRRWRGNPAAGWALPSLLLLGGCQEVLLPEEPGNGPVSNFEYVWEEVDRHYSFFEIKDIDWNGIGDFYRDWVEPNTRPRDLFNLIAEMLDRLQDGHVSLQSSFSTYRYTGWYQPHPRNFDFAFLWTRRVQEPGIAPSGKIYHGWVAPGIGYVYLPTFKDSGWAAEMDQVLERLAGAEALVVDVRDNSGGWDENARKIGGRFTSQRRLFRRIQYRNGPLHGDFSRLEDQYLEPAGSSRFSGPVAVLTNRRTFSAGESFVLAMRTIPGVTVVGDTTGGGSGNPLFRELPNGWTLSISRWIEWAPDGTTHEGVGIPPDILVTIPAHLVGMADPILVAAVRHLQGVLQPDAPPGSPDPVELFGGGSG